MSHSRLYLVRHGETEGNSRVRLNGATDVPLSSHGRAQMASVCAYLTPQSIDYGVASPLCRSRESADIVLSPHACSIDVVEGFREIDFGNWETWTFAEVEQRDPSGYRTYQEAKGDFQFPGGDSRKAFRARITESTVQNLESRSGIGVAALHKGVIKVVTAALLRAHPDEYANQPCELGSITTLERTDGCWRLVQANFVHHLGSLHLAD